MRTGIVVLIIIFSMAIAVLAEEIDPLMNMDIDSMAEEFTSPDAKEMFSIGGYLEIRNRLRAKDMDDPISLRQRLWLEADMDKGRLRGFVSGYFDYDPALRDWTDDSNQLYYPALNEAYLTLDTDIFDLIIGRKMMRWGTGDGINPMDLINPKDYRNPIAGARADARVPILLTDAIFSMGPITMEAVLIPKPEVNKFPLSGSPWEPLSLKNLRTNAASGAIVLASNQEPDEWFKDVEFAFRASTVSKGFDLALLYYNGYPDDPAFHRDYLTDGRIRFTLGYTRYQAYGFNFATSLGSATIRGELALKPGLPFSIDTNDPFYATDNDGLVNRDLYQCVLGVDRTFYTNLYLNFQIFADFIENGNQTLASDRKTHGIAFEVSDNFIDDDLKAGIRGTHFTSNDGSVFEFYAECKIGDNWQIEPGYMSFHGPKDSRLGQFGNNDMIYLRGRYSF